MSTLMDINVQLDEITQRAQKVPLGRSLLALVASVLYGIGWLFSKAWLALVWCAIAVQVGWRDARAASSGGD